jgi:hypothetical protein
MAFPREYPAMASHCSDAEVSADSREQTIESPTHVNILVGVPVRYRRHSIAQAGHLCGQLGGELIPVDSTTAQTSTKEARRKKCSPSIKQ